MATNPKPTTITDIEDDILSPGFRSVAALAGWDEEALISATLIVDDTPLRNSRRQNRTFKSPPTTSSRQKLKRLRRNKIPRVVLNLDDSEDEGEKEVSKKEEGEKGQKGIECIDKLREELSCAICLEICFEPSTTTCGHSFCKKCLNSAAEKCGRRCPKCRQSISYGRDCTINTVLWNTIQLLFPEEVKEKKKAIAETSSSSGTKDKVHIPDRFRRASSSSLIRGPQRYRVSRTSGPSQSEDAALALRLQRQEFLGGFQDSGENQIEELRSRLRAINEEAHNNIRRRRQERHTFRVSDI